MLSPHTRKRKSIRAKRNTMIDRSIRHAQSHAQSIRSKTGRPMSDQEAPRKPFTPIMDRIVIKTFQENQKSL
ncbi:hypothetical protein ZOSMA_30G00130 [Zostera marina]|uniref:Uncharacterized protein n=1 Tax=Zostera marina TaxID=29655 RepID=A0A0K9PBW6_ZOSMR|nr:hypothetical protein ZOSMA_30G00130 [Zostera marina]